MLAMINTGNFALNMALLYRVMDRGKDSFGCTKGQGCSGNGELVLALLGIVFVAGLIFYTLNRD